MGVRMPYPRYQSGPFFKEQQKPEKLPRRCIAEITFRGDSARAARARILSLGIDICDHAAPVGTNREEFLLKKREINTRMHD